MWFDGVIMYTLMFVIPYLYCRNKLTQSEVMATAITRNNYLKSRTGHAVSPDSSVTVLEMAKSDLAKQKQKAQVVLRTNNLSRMRCVKPVKPRNSYDMSSYVDKGIRAKARSALIQGNNGRMKLVSPKLPWNMVDIPSKIDTGRRNPPRSRSSCDTESINYRPQHGLRNTPSHLPKVPPGLPKSSVVIKRPKPKPAIVSHPVKDHTPKERSVATNTDNPNGELNTTVIQGTTVVLRRKVKTTSVYSPEDRRSSGLKRRSRSVDSFLDTSASEDFDVSPTQCFKCQKDLSKIHSSCSLSSKISDYSSMSDINGSQTDIAYRDENNNVDVTKNKHKLSHQSSLRHLRNPALDIMSDTEWYSHRNDESDTPLTDGEYAAGISSDTEFYKLNKKAAARRNLYLDSPMPALMQNNEEVTAKSIELRKAQLQEDLDSLLDSMAFVLSSAQEMEQQAQQSLEPDDPMYKAPGLFRPIFEVKI